MQPSGDRSWCAFSPWLPPTPQLSVHPNLHRACQSSQATVLCTERQVTSLGRARCCCARIAVYFCSSPRMAVAQPWTTGASMQAVDSIIAAVRDVLGSTGCVAFDRAMLQRCPGPAVTRVRRHLPSMTSELLAAVAAATPTAATAGNPSVTPSALPVSPVLGLRTMPEAAKAAKAALECAVGGSSLTAAPASAAAVSVSPTHSRQQSAGTRSSRLLSLGMCDLA